MTDLARSCRGLHRNPNVDPGLHRWHAVRSFLPPDLLQRAISSSESLNKLPADPADWAGDGTPAGEDAAVTSERLGRTLDLASRGWWRLAGRRDFYEHTACWRMEAWAQWSALFQPGGELVSRLFGRRVQQLALPARPLDVAHGMDSRVVHLMDANGEQYAAGWLRTLSATGEFVYSGCYSARLMPASDQPSVHVAFPLESGNVQVFLRPSVQADGSLVLSSPSGVFGGNGAYVVVRDGREAYAARVPIHERFHVYRDHRGVLRTDHELRLYRTLVLRLHYRMEPA
jgi:hypothetical protein